MVALRNDEIVRESGMTAATILRVPGLFKLFPG
jgi:hypothetical protein